MKKSQNKENLKWKSRPNPNRRAYITEQEGYVYTVWDNENQCDRTHSISSGVTKEVLEFLDENDHQMYLQERYNSENADYRFLNQQHDHDDGRGSFLIDPIENIMDKHSDPFEILYSKEEGQSELMLQLLEIMNQLTDKQRNLIYDHFGAMKQLEKIRQEEIAATGRTFSQQAMSNRWNRIIVRCRKKLTLLQRQGAN